MKIKNLLMVLIIALIAFGNSAANAAESLPSLVFHQNSDGQTVAGTIDDLKQAVRDGKRVRLYMNLGAVEHAMDGGFLTIFNGHVYAQINTIQGQRPDRKTGKVELRPFAKHVGLYSTESPYEIKWYVY